MFTTLQYADFFNIITVAIGINLTYIIIDSNQAENRRKFAFFGFLSTVSDRILSWIAYLNQKDLKREEATRTKIQYYCKSNKLEEQTLGAFNMLLRQIDESVQQLKSIEEKSQRQISACCRASNLSKVSLVCALYGIYVLFVGGLQYKINTLNVDRGLFLSNIAFILMIVHCLLWEKSTLQFWKESKKYEHKKRCRYTNLICQYVGYFLCPRFLLFIILFLIIAVWSFSVIFSSGTWIHLLYDNIIGENKHINLFLTLLMCYSGFIVYTIVAIFFSAFFSFKFMFKLQSLKIHNEVRGIEKKITHYKSELDRIDCEMSTTVHANRFTASSPTTPAQTKK